MVKILFICHGNICRSPMAEFIMKDLVKKAGQEHQFCISSAATSAEETGCPVYPPARRKLQEHGIGCEGKTARQLIKADYSQYDLLIGMDRANIRNMNRICGGDPCGKIHLLMEFARPSPRPGGANRAETGKCSMFSPQTEAEKRETHFSDVADPWYTGDFDAAWRDIAEGCEGLLRALQEQADLSKEEKP